MNFYQKFSLLAVAVTVFSAQAQAQKSKDTLRLALNVTVPVLSSYDLPVNEGSLFALDIYDFLMKYDEFEKKMVPGLAKSWKRIDEKTTEFELREDIKFHNGDRFDANDVKATVDYIIDPTSKITYPGRYTWVKEIEILGPYKLRFHSVEPTATDLMTIAYRFHMWNGKVLNNLKDRADYGRLSPIGTGPYKISSLDTNKGIAVERYDDYNTMPKYKRAHIKRITAAPIPDLQTQTAELMVGNLDLLRNVKPDIAKSLVEKPDFKISYINSPDLIYLALDSVGLAGNKALTDPRVRRAIHMGIDRESIIKYIVPGGEIAELPQADCFKTTIACSYSVQPPKYDPAAAKKLLAEAGYPDGFELQYLVHAPHRAIGEAVAGNLLKIGVRATIQLAEIGLYRRLQGDGKLQSWTIVFPTGGYPDAGNIFNVLFTGPAMTYFNDNLIVDAMVKGESEFDPDKRAAIYAKAFDRINEMHYHLPISSVPTVFVHTKDVKVNEGTLSSGVPYVTDFQWN